MTIAKEQTMHDKIDIRKLRRVVKASWSSWYRRMSYHVLSSILIAVSEPNFTASSYYYQKQNEYFKPPPELPRDRASYGLRVSKSAAFKMI